MNQSTFRTITKISNFILIITILYGNAVNANGQFKIAPPDPKPPKPPKGVSQETADDDLANLRRNHREKDREDPTKQKNRIKSLDQKLEDVSSEPGPMRFMSAASLVLPIVATSGNKRKNYNAELSGFFHCYIDPSEQEDFDKYKIWTGFRIAPISGTGIYENTSGRFGFTYFGPMVGIGKVSPAFFKTDKKEQAPEDKRPVNYDRDAFFIMGGVSALAKSGFVEKGRNRPDDFNNTGISLDTPGAFVEFTYAQISYSKLSQNFLSGVQIGRGKIFIIVAYGLGFWY